MNKNILLSIFIYIFIIACESSPIECEDCYISIEASSLTIDENGYYHIQFLDGYTQTFTTLKVETGIEDYYQKVKWLSNKRILLGNYWTDLVNNSSYTDDYGQAYTVLSVWQEFIGDTIKVYSGYTDNCSILHADSLEVIVE